MQILAVKGADQYSSSAFRVAAEVALGVAGGAFAIVLHVFFGIWAPEVSAFSLVYPLLLVGPLYGHRYAGLIAGTMSFAWGWWDVVPPPNSFGFEIKTGAAMVALHATTAMITFAFALAFRRAMDAALEERDLQIARGAMLIQELEHRTKNNFALVASLLQAQKRRESDTRITQALDLACARIHSFARAYTNLAQSENKSGLVAMKTYLSEVVSHFADGGFPDNVTVTVDACECPLPRETAVGIGLFANEALTNCAKHAFPDNRPGRVQVSLKHGAQSGSELTVEDDGVGLDAAGDSTLDGGTGSRLMEAFAHQAHARFTLEPSTDGTRVRLADHSGSSEPSAVEERASGQTPPPASMQLKERR